MKKAEHSFLTLTICVVVAMFIGLTVLACGKTTGTDLSSQPKTLTINNTTIYDLTDLHFNMIFFCQSILFQQLFYFIF